MRTITTTVEVFKFDELSDKAKEKALDHYRYFQVEDDWWDFIYEDAERIGLKITEFGLDRNRHAKGEFLLSACEVAANIFKEHGNQCGTHKTAQDFQYEWDKLVEKYSDGKDTECVAEENQYEFNQEADEMEESFLESILEDYSIMLQNECEYLTSDESVTEFIEANDYEFTEDGNRI